MTVVDAEKEITELLAQFSPGKPSLLPALHKVQEHYGYIPPWAIPALGKKLHIPVADIYGIITFYSELRLEPLPETLISWCSGPACRLKGGERLRKIIEVVLGVKMRETAEDGSVGLHLGQCNGTCHMAPMVWINGQPRGPLTLAEAIRLAHELKARSESHE